MDTRRIAVIALLACMVGVLILSIVETASAQDEDVTKEFGRGGQQAPKSVISGEGPTKLQMAIGVGSVLVMIAVLKWL